MRTMYSPVVQGSISTTKVSLIKAERWTRTKPYGSSFSAATDRDSRRRASIGVGVFSSMGLIFFGERLGEEKSGAAEHERVGNVVEAVADVGGDGELDG